MSAKHRTICQVGGKATVMRRKKSMGEKNGNSETTTEMVAWGSFKITIMSTNGTDRRREITACICGASSSELNAAPAAAYTVAKRKYPKSEEEHEKQQEFRR